MPLWIQAGLANKPYVDPARENLHLGVGCEVTCLFGDAKLKNSASVTVASEVPLFLDCSALEVAKYTFPRKVVLIFQEGDKVLRGDADAIGSQDLGDGKHRIQISKIVWENVDRRQHPRLSIKIPVKLRAVYESKDETVISVVDGYTEDLSIGGSKIHIENPVMKGSLVEFSANLHENDAIRALGLVVHSDDAGLIRVAFMDYVGATRSKLDELTRKAAA